MRVPVDVEAAETSQDRRVTEGRLVPSLLFCLQAKASMLNFACCYIRRSCGVPSAGRVEQGPQRARCRDAGDASGTHLLVRPNFERMAPRLDLHRRSAQTYTQYTLRPGRPLHMAQESLKSFSQERLRETPSRGAAPRRTPLPPLVLSGHAASLTPY